jgi:hypothetical protein
MQPPKDLKLARKNAAYAVIARTIYECQEDATQIEVERLRRLAFMIVDAVSENDSSFERDAFLRIAGFGETPRIAEYESVCPS